MNMLHSYLLFLNLCNLGNWHYYPVQGILFPERVLLYSFHQIFVVTFGCDPLYGDVHVLRYHSLEFLETPLYNQLGNPNPSTCDALISVKWQA